MNCNPNAIACQLDLIRQSLNNPNVFQIWGFVVAIIAAIGSVAVAIVAARIAWQSNKTAETANRLTAEAQSITRDVQDRESTRADAAAADAARKERYEFAELLHAYLLDASREWEGKKPKSSTAEQWVAIAKRAYSLASANASGSWIARATSRTVDRMKASKRSLLVTPAEIQAESDLATAQMLRLTEWVTDPDAWMETHGIALRESILAERANKGHAYDEQPHTPT